MKYLKKYYKFQESILYFGDIMESMQILSDSLLQSIGAELISPIDEIKYSLSDKTLEDLDENSEFINSLSSLGYRKSEIQNTNDYETFLNKSCKFILIHRMEALDIENPLYIVLQTWDEPTKKWGECTMYKVNGDMKRFYDKLSSKTIEIIYDDENYIYKTSNSGNNWDLMNKKETDKFKRQLRKEDMLSLLSTPDIKVNIV